MSKESKSSDHQWQTGRQYFAAIAANIIQLVQGSSNGWISPVLPKFLSEETPLVASGPLSLSEVSWLGSAASIGSMCGCFTFGFVTSFSGCKRAMIFLGIPATIFWILVYFGDAYHHILLTRFIAGWTGGGIHATNLLYISQIANNNVRGQLGAIGQLSLNIGTLGAYIIGAFVEYEYIPYIFITFPVIYLVCFVFLPNTPQYHLERNQTQKAENALKYYKGYKGKSEEEKSAFTAEFEQLKSLATEQQKDQNLHISDFTTRESIKGMIIGITLGYIVQMAGSLTIITYGAFIVERTGTTLDPSKSSISLAAMLILGSLCTTQVADALGRKTFLIISCLSNALFLIGLSAFLYLSTIGYDLSDISWIPIVCLAFSVFISQAGIVPLCQICRVENLPTKIRTLGMSICIFFLSVLSFMCTKVFPILVESVGLHCCMMIFAINCIFGSVFVYFVLDETRGKPMDELQSDQNHIEITRF